MPEPKRSGKNVAFVGMGSNLGDRRATLCGALRALRRLPETAVCSVSSFLRTEPVGGPPGQGEFLNAAVRLSTTLPPHDLLEVLQRVEDEFGRERDVRWGPRTLDLDILLYGRRVIEEPDLQVPHPRMHERRFVLEPLCQIAPNAVHPVLHKTVRELLEELPTPGRSGPR